MSDPRSAIPSVDRLLADARFVELVASHGHARVLEATREVVGHVREAVRGGIPETRLDDPGRYAAEVAASLAAADVPSLRPVVNATGVVLHTNLGRAPLADEAAAAMARAATVYSNLEYDLDEGARGSRYVHCVTLLTELTGAEDALVVNNAAAALVLTLNTLATGAGVVVSRGELVEIGGGFRIPDMIERAGTELVEVGSTNRTRLSDYREVLGDGAVRAILKVHRSNFRITGFTEEASLADLAGLGDETSVPLVYDLGSGLLVEPGLLGLPGEPRPQEALREGAGLVVFSGDKLLGGPQAGVIVGRRDLVARLRANPLCRALRVDKTTLAGLEATLRLYRRPEQALDRIPVLRMLASKEGALRERAERLSADLAANGIASRVVPALGRVGGGTFPGVELASHAVALAPTAPAALADALRRGDPPVVARIVDDRLLLDVRTVLPGQEADVVRRVVEAWPAGSKA